MKIDFVSVLIGMIAVFASVYFYLQNSKNPEKNVDELNVYSKNGLMILSVIVLIILLLDFYKPKLQDVGHYWD